MYSPKVSIIIPAYNASNYLAEAIDSALNQTYENVEVIVVNDGSKDDDATRRIALSYGNRIRYIEKDNGGSSSALNVGIQNMRGEWFSWLSHDDVYLSRKVEREVEELRRLRKIVGDEVYRYVICCASEEIDAYGKLLRTPTVRQMERKAAYIASISENRLLIAEPTEHNYHGCGYLIHRRVFRDVGLFNEDLRLLNDIDMWFRIYAANYRLVYIPEVLVQGRIHKKQISKQIGFSYHNPEQDLFWRRSLNWLKAECPEDCQVFLMFGRNAISKTRYVEGKEAFRYIGMVQPKRRLRLFGTYLVSRIEAEIVRMIKNLYIRTIK